MTKIYITKKRIITVFVPATYSLIRATKVEKQNCTWTYSANYL